MRESKLPNRGNFVHASVSKREAGEPKLI